MAPRYEVYLPSCIRATVGRLGFTRLQAGFADWLWILMLNVASWKNDSYAHIKSRDQVAWNICFVRIQLDRRRECDADENGRNRHFGDGNIILIACYPRR